MKIIYQKILYCLIMLIFLGCSNKSKEERILGKEEQILEKVALSYIEKFQLEPRWIQKLFYPTIVIVRENSVYKGKKKYSIYHLYQGLFDDLPTHLIKRGNVYIAMYLTGQQSISKKNIPKSLINNYGYAELREWSWVVLICPDSYEFIVVHIEEAHGSYDCVKQLREFKCDKKTSNISGKVKVEKEIVDRDDPPPLVLFK